MTTRLTYRLDRSPVARARRAATGLALVALAATATSGVLAVNLADARADATTATDRADAAETAASWAVDTATDRPADDTTDPESVATGDATVASWSGFTVGQVIYCPVGWIASVDTTADGHQWAACM